MELAPGETKERVGEVAGRLPRRGAARPDEERARHAAGREAQVVAGARRRVRARGRRLRLARRAARGGARRTWRSTRRARRTRWCASSCIDEIIAGEPVRRAAELGEPADRRLHAGVPDPRRASASTFAARVRVDGGAAGAARPDHRHDRRAARADGDRERTSTTGSRRSPSSAARIRARCTRRCRRRGDCRRSSAASRKRRCSSG